MFPRSELAEVEAAGGKITNRLSIERNGGGAEVAENREGGAGQGGRRGRGGADGRLEGESHDAVGIGAGEGERRMQRGVAWAFKCDGVVAGGELHGAIRGAVLRLAVDGERGVGRGLDDGDRQHRRGREEYSQREPETNGEDEQTCGTAGQNPRAT